MRQLSGRRIHNRLGLPYPGRAIGPHMSRPSALPGYGRHRDTRPLYSTSVWYWFRVHPRFLVSPMEIIGRRSVEGLRIEEPNRLGERAQPVGTGVYETLEVRMVLRAAGYRGQQPVAGAPLGARSGTTPNESGCTCKNGTELPGEFVAGWIKHQPSGVMGTNKACAVETVARLLEDPPALPRTPQPNPDAAMALLAERGAPGEALIRKRVCRGPQAPWRGSRCPRNTIILPHRVPKGRRRRASNARRKRPAPERQPCGAGCF
jgi:hypothetical protein